MAWSAAKYNDRECLRFVGESMTFSEVDSRSAQLANLLVSRGVAKGDRVAILLPNSCDWPISWIAVLRAGAIAVPINVRYRSADLAHVLHDAGATLVLTDNAHGPLLHQITDAARLVLEEAADAISAESETAPDIPLAPSDLANLQYTSGTTGLPKACMLSHDYWLRNSWELGRVGQLTDEDVVLTAQPFSYIDPQWNLTLGLQVGFPLVILPGFSASGFWPAIRENGVTWCYMIGTMPVLLFRQPPIELDRKHRMRMILCSGINPSLHRDFESRWGVPWREVYGLTEEGGCLAVPLEESDLVGSGIIGRPFGSKRVEVVDTNGQPVADGQVGELVVEGEPLMLGYWQRPEDTARALRGNRLYTGDLGYRDPQGWFRIVGRSKDMVRRGGENISSAEVERVVDELPTVAVSAVIAVPDQTWGEEAMLCVQLATSRSNASQNATGEAERILKHARERLAPFKVPRFVQFIDRMPTTPSERVAKGKLNDRASTSADPCFDATDGTWKRLTLAAPQ